MTAIATPEHPAEIVADYHVMGLRLWQEGRSPHGPRHRCLICSDTRAYLKRAPLDPPSIVTVKVLPEPVAPPVWTPVIEPVAVEPAPEPKRQRRSRKAAQL